jgi:hypothetical protein
MYHHVVTTLYRVMIFIYYVSVNFESKTFNWVMETLETLRE